MLSRRTWCTSIQVARGPEAKRRKNWVAFCLGTEVSRHSAGIVGTYDHTAIRTYVRNTLIVFITIYTALHMLEHIISHVQNGIAKLIGNSHIVYSSWRMW